MEKIENDKNMIVLKPVGNAKSPGYTAVFMDLSQQKGRINIIGNRQNSSMSVFITSKTETGTKYTRLGQADKRSYIFDKSMVSGTITGAVIGRADSKGALSMRYLEGSLNNNSEAPKNVYVKGISAKDTATEKLEDEPQKSEEEKNKDINEDKKLSENIEKPIAEPKTEPKREIVNDVAKSNSKNIEKPVKQNTATTEKEPQKTISPSSKNPNLLKVTSTNNSKYAPSGDEIKAEDTFKRIMSDFSAQMKKLESMGIINSNEAAEIQSSGPKSKKNDIFCTNEKVYPFDNSSFDWVKGTIDDLWLMGCDAKRLYRSFVLSRECQNGHILIGSPFDRSCVVVGVPCEYNEKDSKCAHDAGFVDFWKSSINDNQQSDGNFGYWIMNM